jgi:hypothetical protein
MPAQQIQYVRNRLAWRCQPLYFRVHRHSSSSSSTSMSVKIQ